MLAVHTARRTVARPPSQLLIGQMSNNFDFKLPHGKHNVLPRSLSSFPMRSTLHEDPSLSIFILTQCSHDPEKSSLQLQVASNLQTQEMKPTWTVLDPPLGREINTTRISGITQRGTTTSCSWKAPPHATSTTSFFVAQLQHPRAFCDLLMHC